MIHLCKYSRRQNKVSVPFALHGERSENGDITVVHVVLGLVCTSKTEEHLGSAKGATGKL